MPGMKQITSGNIRLMGSAMANAFARSRRRSRKIVGLPAKRLGDATAHLFRLNQRRNEDRYGRDFQAAGHSPQGFHTCSACQEVRLIGAELSGQGAIFGHRIQNTCQGSIETQPGLAERGQKLQGDRQILLDLLPCAAAVTGGRLATARVPGSRRQSKVPSTQSGQGDRPRRAGGGKCSWNNWFGQAGVSNGKHRGEPQMPIARSIAVTNTAGAAGWR